MHSARLTRRLTQDILFIFKIFKIFNKGKYMQTEELIKFNGRKKIAQEIENIILPILDELRDESIIADEISKRHYSFLCKICNITNIYESNFVNNALYEDIWYEMKYSDRKI